MRGACSAIMFMLKLLYIEKDIAYNYSENMFEKKPTKKDLLSLKEGKTVHVNYTSIAHASTTYRKDLLRCVS